MLTPAELKLARGSEGYPPIKQVGIRLFERPRALSGDVVRKEISGKVINLRMGINFNTVECIFGLTLDDSLDRRFGWKMSGVRVTGSRLKGC
jgi:uncharacterized protein YbcI